MIEKHLTENKAEYLVGNKCTIADITHIGWVGAAGWAGIELDDFPALKAWKERMYARAAVDKGADVPTPRSRKAMTEEEKNEAAAKARAWIQAGMKDDAAKHQAKV